MPIIQIKLSSNVMDGDIKVGIHNQMRVGFESMKVEIKVLVNNNDVTKTRDVVNDLDRIALKVVPVDKLMIDRSDVNRIDKTINLIDRSLIASSFGQRS